MKYWNELDESIFFCKLFSHPIEIGRISLFSLQIENDQPSLGLGFDIPEFPDNLPEKWQNKGFNTCRLGLTCSNISDLKITNIPTKEIFSATIAEENGILIFQAAAKKSSIEFKAQFISLNGPSVYINDPEDDKFLANPKHT
ncbi:hypothetical protein HX864_23755 [Pseudomonas yamanorum]|uniref:Imm50 family immunity protein n=1 Tax=Pseudomonas yamanorum TaxID=515393 RepID=UPI0015A082AE|nr:Imm50 family immunity protein [Pseudomonas yamanorum]NWD26303.1 hypothetical protein [Pseudomonas yamanorum]